MTWDQACAYWDRGAISTDNLRRVAHDLFEGDVLDDVIRDIDTVEPRYVVQGGTAAT